MKHSAALLSSNQYETLLDHLTDCLVYKNAACINRTLDWAQNLIEFEAAAVVQIYATQSQQKVAKIVNHSYTAKWVKKYIDEGFVQHDPVIKFALGSTTPFTWSQALESIDMPQQFWAFVQEFSPYAGITHAFQRPLGGTHYSVISLSNVCASREPIAKYLLAVLAPTFYEVMCSRTQQTVNGNNSPHLTPKEKEVLNWAMEGKSIWDTATILSIAERTVKFHLQNVYRKLNVLNRTQAIAIALKQDLI